MVDPDVLAGISHDEAEWAPAGKAVAGVRARTEAEVQHVVRTCAEFGTPIVPRGAGTGLSGGANAVGGCVILDLSRMNQVLEIDLDNLVCVVQPGAVNNDVKAAVAEHGLWYPAVPAGPSLPLMPSPSGDPSLRMRMSRDGAGRMGPAAPSLRRLAQALGDEAAEGQSVFTAASRFCAAVLTWPRADTTPDTVLTPGLAPRLLTAVFSVSRAALSALLWA